MTPYWKDTVQYREYTDTFKEHKTLIVYIRAETVTLISQINPQLF